MKAIVCHKFATPDSLKYEDIADPTPQAGEVLIGVKACGINFADALMVMGKYQVKPELPFSPGFEVSGEVLALGDGVSQFQLGQRVVGLINYGALAEKVAAPAHMVIPLVDSLDDRTAASFAVAYGTSHVALEHRGQLKEGETLLVHGAAGGVGLAAVELGKLLGANVIATASTAEKLELCKRYGADHTINYKEDDFVARVKEITGGKGANVIFDPVGGEVFEKSLRCIAWEGRILVIGFASGNIPNVPANIALVKNCSVVGVYWGQYGQKDPKVLMGSLQKLIGWHAEGKLKPHISQVYPLEQTATAMMALLQRKSTGKVVVEVA